MAEIGIATHHDRLGEVKGRAVSVAAELEISGVIISARTRIFI
jgi:hypothetical protein